jgi:hypothetical protein
MPNARINTFNSNKEEYFINGKLYSIFFHRLNRCVLWRKQRGRWKPVLTFTPSDTPIKVTISLPYSGRYWKLTGSFDAEIVSDSSLPDYFRIQESTQTAIGG